MTQFQQASVQHPQVQQPQIQAINDFVVKFANVNGSGSASANELFAKTITSSSSTKRREYWSRATPRATAACWIC